MVFFKLSSQRFLGKVVKTNCAYDSCVINSIFIMTLITLSKGNSWV